MLCTVGSIGQFMSTGHLPLITLEVAVMVLGCKPQSWMDRDIPAPDCQSSLLISFCFWLAAKFISSTVTMLKEENKFWHGGEKRRLFGQAWMLLKTESSPYFLTSLCCFCASPGFSCLSHNLSNLLCYDGFGKITLMLGRWLSLNPAPISSASVWYHHRTAFWVLFIDQQFTKHFSTMTLNQHILERGYNDAIAGMSNR